MSKKPLLHKGFTNCSPFSVSENFIYSLFVLRQNYCGNALWEEVIYQAFSARRLRACVCFLQISAEEKEYETLHYPPSPSSCHQTHLFQRGHWQEDLMICMQTFDSFCFTSFMFNARSSVSCYGLCSDVAGGSFHAISYDSNYQLCNKNLRRAKLQKVTVIEDVANSGAVKGHQILPLIGDWKSDTKWTLILIFLCAWCEKCHHQGQLETVTWHFLQMCYSLSFILLCSFFSFIPFVVCFTFLSFEIFSVFLCFTHHQFTHSQLLLLPLTWSSPSPQVFVISPPP